MTAQEALSLLNDMEFDKKYQGKQEYAEMLLVCKEALEKQIPKKPKAHIVDVEKLKIGNANWCEGTTVYRCPSCNDFISRIYDFCHKCGQKIDWSDNNG